MTTPFDLLHPRGEHGRFDVKPQSASEARLPEADADDGYRPGSGVAPDGFVFPPLRDGMTPDRVEMNLFVRHYPLGMAWHLTIYPFDASDSSASAQPIALSLGRPPRDLGEYTRRSRDDIFGGDAWMTLEESPKWVRDYALWHVAQRSERELAEAAAYMEWERRGRVEEAGRVPFRALND